MENHIKFSIKMFMIVALYILLGSLGMYTSIIFLLFPIINLPMLYYMIKQGDQNRQWLIISGIVGISVFFITGSSIQTMMYFIFVVLTSYLIKYYHTNAYSIPHMIMYTGAITVGAMYIYMVLMKYIGVDFLQQYMYILEEYQTIMLTQIDYIAQVGGQMTEQAEMLTTAVKIQIELMRLLYPAIFFVFGIGLTFVNIVLFRFVAKVKHIPMQSMKQLGEFKFSRKILLLFALAMLCMQVNNSSAMMMGSNLLLLVTMLLECAGFIASIVLIKRSKLSVLLKVGVIISSLMIFYLLPSVLMMIGMFDTVFNFRKVEIIV